VYLDATTGLGGHALAVLKKVAAERAILLDRDDQALAVARSRMQPLAVPMTFVHTDFASVADVLVQLGVGEVAAIVADLGVSSLQLDRPERGFSFRADGPLDMRMNPTQGITAAELLATVDVQTLAAILRELGEEQDARRIARAIVRARPKTTRALADVVSQAMSDRQKRQLGTRIHPATRTFQALRMHINRELEQLDRFLHDAPNLLAVGGRLAIITFHSLEDRRVKHHMRRLSRANQPPSDLPVVAAELPTPRFVVPPAYRRGLVPDADELHDNPRCRSARLRVMERVAI
jgi:16S rRNA (cytosine1402-N4)-methyltransferase